MPLEVLRRVYAAADIATLPVVDDMKPCTWWRSLIACAYNLGFRRGAWMRLESSAIGWNDAVVRLPAELDKRGQERVKPCNQVVVKHLLRVRRARGVVFPWPHAGISFDRTWHRIQRAAGLTRDEQFTFHDLKRKCGTQLAAIASTWQVRYMLDHSQPDVTGLYVDPLPELPAVVERMPQPPALLKDGPNQLRLFA